MADFEGLIRQALARQDVADPAVRQKVYQSSRNALARMIAAAGPQPPAVINEQRVALENSISRIEAGYSLPSAPPPSPTPQPAAPRPAPAAPAAPVGRREPEFVPPPPPDDGSGDYDDDRREPDYMPDNGEFEPSDGEDFAVSADDAPVYARRSGGMRRVLPMLLLVIVLGGAAWLTYSLVNSLLESASQAPSTPVAGNAGGEAKPDEAFVYVTVLSPQDTSALQLEGRGKAEIVNQSNMDMIRLTSVRPEGKRSEQAEPILIALSDGVLSQVAGKLVTVELQAKSGKAEPATFSIRCDFAGEEACGRKRFSAGPQPGTVIFTVQFPQDAKPGGKYNLMINTDVAQASGASAEGDPIDIISARLRYDKQ